MQDKELYLQILGLVTMHWVAELQPALTAQQEKRAYRKTLLSQTFIGLTTTAKARELLTNCACKETLL